LGDDATRRQVLDKLPALFRKLRVQVLSESEQTNLLAEIVAKE